MAIASFEFRPTGGVGPSRPAAAPGRTVVSKLSLLKKGHAASHVSTVFYFLDALIAVDCSQPLSPSSPSAAKSNIGGRQKPMMQVD